jgi:hypothetical protein
MEIMIENILKSNILFLFLEESRTYIPVHPAIVSNLYRMSRPGKINGAVLVRVIHIKVMIYYFYFKRILLKHLNIFFN